jgi:hypothetical protein
MTTRLARSVHFVASVTAFVIGAYAFSNLMPLVLAAVESGMNLVDGALITGYALATILAILLLAREIYRLDHKAGRIRNRVRCFE